MARQPPERPMATTRMTRTISFRDRDRELVDQAEIVADYTHRSFSSFAWHAIANEIKRLRQEDPDLDEVLLREEQG